MTNSKQFIPNHCIPKTSMGMLMCFSTPYYYLL